MKEWIRIRKSRVLL